MSRKISCIFIFMFITLTGFSRGSRVGSDTLFFTPTYFQLRLDSLYLGQFRQALKGHERENKQMLSEALPGLKDLSEAEISKQVNEMNSIINVGYTPKVKEFIDVLLYKKPEASCLLLTLADHYVPVFQPIFDKYRVPRELAYLPSVVSAFNPGASSMYGSTGIWNIMYLTGKLYKLEINSMVDERRNYEKSTDAAARQLKDYFNIYQDWTLALTAYITGPAVVNKAIRRANGKRDFWSLYPYLPYETRDYLPAYIAMTYFVNYHKILSLKPLQADLSFASDTVCVTQELHLRQVSKILDIPMNLLRTLNPQYKRDILPAGIKACTLNLPVTYGEKFRSLKKEVFNYKDSVVLSTRQPSSLFPGSFYTSRDVQVAPLKKTTTSFHTVRKGESLGAIASRYHVSVSQLKIWNRLRSTTIRAGQKLMVHAPARPPANKK